MRHFACAVALALLPSLAVAQEKTVPTPRDVKAEGMPPVPQSVLDGVARYAQFRQAQLIAWHPTKRQMLIATSFTTTQLHMLDGPLRDRRQLTWMPRGFGNPFAVNASFAPGDPDSLVFQYDPAGTELRSFYRYDFKTGEPALVVEAKSRYAPVWSPQGGWLAYDSAERNGKDRDLYVIQPSDPKTRRRLGEFAGAWSPQQFSPDGTTLLVTEVLGNSETYIWRVDVKTGEKTAITPRDGEKAGFFNARFSADGRKVYALSDRASGDFRIWRCEIAKCVWTPVSPAGMAFDGPNDSGAGFELSPDGTLLAGTADRGATSELQVIDLTTLKPRALPPIPIGTVTKVQWRPGSREVGFTLNAVYIPGDVYSIDTSLGSLVRWTASEVSFNADNLPLPELVDWKSFDGEAISGILYRPAAKFTGPRPVVINIHGGPDLRERKRWQGRSNYLLNELGVAIIYPNVRGSSGFGRRFQSLDDGKLRGNVVKDIGALLDWIAARPELDKNRVALLGVSSGGWLALEAGIAYGDRIRGVVEGAGITNFVTFLEGTDPARQENRRLEYGDERDPAMREFLTSLSPVTRAAALKKPTLVIHPGKDSRVPVAQAQELVKSLKSSNPNVWYLEFSEANHDNLPGVGGDYMLAAWMWFFKSFLLN